MQRVCGPPSSTSERSRGELCRRVGDTAGQLAVLEWMRSLDHEAGETIAGPVHAIPKHAGSDAEHSHDT
jgi:hypothetical protein